MQWGVDTSTHALRAHEGAVHACDEATMHAVQTCQTCGGRKLLAFALRALQEFNPRYILRMSDSVAVVAQNLPEAVRQWVAMRADYIGCMVHGAQKVPNRPIELPQNADRDLVAAQYPTFAAIDAYAVAGSMVRHALAPNAAALRHLDLEGIALECEDQRALPASGCLWLLA